MSTFDGWYWREDTDTEPPRRHHRETRSTIGSVLFLLAAAVLVVLVWPAKWGGPFGTTVVVGHSMDGTYSTGDLVITHRRAVYSPGDVIVYTVHYGEATGTVVHRIVAETSGHFTTKGDNNEFPDPWPVSTSDISGEVALRLPKVGWAILISRTPLFLMTLTGAIVTWLLWPRDAEAPEPDPHDPSSWEPPTGPAYALAPPPPVSAFPREAFLSPAMAFTPPSTPSAPTDRRTWPARGVPTSAAEVPPPCAGPSTGAQQARTPWR